MFGADSRARLRPGLSQHFLRSRSLAASLIAHSSISREDLVVEIGPGRGMLTRELAASARKLVAVEIDRGLLRELDRELGSEAHVRLVAGDFLRFPLPDEDYKVFASIPYGRTAAILRRLVGAKNPPREAHLIVQQESGERFAGCPYAGESVASLSIKPWWHVEITRRLKRTDFYPVPSVDSVVLWLARRDIPLVSRSEGKLYREFIRGSFGRGGTTVRRCLKGVLTGRQMHRLSRDLRFDPSVSPSELNFDQWLGLFRFFSIASGRGPRPRSQAPIQER